MDIEIVNAAVEEFDHYYQIQDKLANGQFNELGIEARKRLLQARRLLLQVIDLESAGLEVNARLGPPWPLDSASDIDEWMNGQEFQNWRKEASNPEQKALARSFSDIGEQIELYCECFYWIAGRTRSIFRLLPGISSFESVGIRNVRNKLVEHPEKPDSGVVFGGFAWGGSQGPVLKAARLDHQKDIFPDLGLNTNATEFFEGVSEVCAKAVANPELIVAKIRRAKIGQ